MIILIIGTRLLKSIYYRNSLSILPDDNLMLIRAAAENAAAISDAA